MADRALGVLARLQRRARFRGWRAGLRSPRGVAFAVATMALVAWTVLSAVGSLRSGLAPVDREAVRRDGPVLLLTLTALVLVAGQGGHLLNWSAAEETFLLAGPFTRRQLIAHKLRAVAANAVMVAAILLLAGVAAWRLAVAAGLSLWLTVLFLELVAVVGALLANLVGAIGWSRLRRGLLVVVGGAAAWAVWQSGLLAGGQFPTGPAVMAAVAKSPVLAWLAAPFRVFVEAFAAPRVWPDFAAWGAGAFLVDAALVGLVFALDAAYLEVASAASARTLARSEQIRSGGGVADRVVRHGGGSARAAWRLPPPAWWGGVGPNLWRHLTAALGSPQRLLVVFLLLASPLIGAWLSGAGRAGLSGWGSALALSAWISVFAGSMLPHDFRADLDRFPVLKTLPIPPTSLALGQLLTPVILIGGMQAVILGVLGTRVAGWPPLAWSALLFLVPAHLVVAAVDNLMFLASPTRRSAGAFDVAATVRQGVFLAAKTVAVAATVGLAAGVAYLLSRWPVVAVAGAWVVVTSIAATLIPVVGRAFERFDVAANPPA